MLGFTIDSIKLFVSWEKLEKFDFETFKKKLIKVKEYKKYYRDRNGYMLWTKGIYRNFKVYFSENKGIYLEGSISTFYKGHTYLLLYSELKQAIEKLGSELSLFLHDSRLYRIDLALNIKTDKPIEQYSHYLFSDLSKFKRLEQDKGVLFTTKSKSFFIYNKSQQLKDTKGIKIPNILRFEFRILKGVSKYFEIEKMKISDIYDKNFFLKLLNGFRETYDKIEKSRVLKDYSELEFITPKIQSQWLKMGTIIRDYGGITEFYRKIQQADLEGKFRNANDKSRCRKEIRELSTNKMITKPHPLVMEISEKINFEIENVKNVISTKSIF